MNLTIISGTNRNNSYTFRVSNVLKEVLRNQNDELSIQLLSLETLPTDFIFSSFRKDNPEFEKLKDKYITHTDAFIFVVPEYNGSYPGILKSWIDCIHPSFFNEKPAGLIGVSSGRAGNLRGLEHLTGVLQYLKMHIFHLKQPISRIEEMFDGEMPKSELNDILHNWCHHFKNYLRVFNTNNH